MSAEGPGWWNDAWPHRRAVTVKALKPTDLPGDDIAVVTFLHGGKARKDAADVRVVADDGTDVKRRIIAAGPGDEITVAFAIRAQISTYKVYYGNAKAEHPKEQLDIRRGVLMEVWPYPGGNANNTKEFDGVVERAQKKDLIGRGFRDRMFIGHNPFGPQDRIVSKQTGYLLCPADGDYLFMLQSHCATSLHVDGKLLVKNYGWHHPRHRRTGKVKLAKGLVKLEMFHVNPWSNPIAIVGWKTPDADKAVPIAPKAFTPVFAAKAGAMEDYGRKVSVDFTVVDAGETFMANRYYQRRVLEASHKGRSTGEILWEWEFGDGQRALGQKVEHIFLEPRDYKIKVRATQGLPPTSRTHALHIDRRWDHVTSRELDKVEDYAKQVHEYDLKTLPTAALAEAIRLFDRAKDAPAVLRAGEAFLARREAHPRDVREVTPILATWLLKQGKVKEAAEAYRKAAGLTTDAGASAEMLVQAAMLRLQKLQDGDGAMKLFEQTVKDYAKQTDDKAIRRARIGMGDVWRARGRASDARKAYEAAGVTDEKARKYPAIVRGNFARQAEDYLRRKELEVAEDTLDDWAMTLPADKLDGYMTLLRVRVLLAREQYGEVVRLATVLVGANPRSSYAAELLLEAATAHIKLKQPDKAVRTLRQITRDYRESPVAVTARQLLQATQPGK